MEYTKLGKRGPDVSTVGFGAWAIGGKNWGPTDDAVSLRALNEALDQRVTLIDTADVYGFGHSEELIAKLIRERGKENVVIATKAGNDFYFASQDDDTHAGRLQHAHIIVAVADGHHVVAPESVDVIALGSHLAPDRNTHAPHPELLRQGGRGASRIGREQLDLDLRGQLGEALGHAI